MIGIYNKEKVETAFEENASLKLENEYYENQAKKDRETISALAETIVLIKDLVDTISDKCNIKAIKGIKEILSNVTVNRGENNENKVD